MIGCFSQLNQMAHEANAQCIIHTGDFGFYGKKWRGKKKKSGTFFLFTDVCVCVCVFVYHFIERSSLERITDR